MQDMASCDYFRTPVIFGGSDNCVFVGDMRKSIVLNQADNLNIPFELLG